MSAMPQPMPKEQAPNSGQDSLQAFRELAQQTQKLAQQFPQFAQSAALILKEIQKGMVGAAGNDQASAPKDAPPNA